MLALLADRDAGGVESWLVQRPDVTVIARGRAGIYAHAAARGAPAAV